MKAIYTLREPAINFRWSINLLSLIFILFSCNNKKTEIANEREGLLEIRKDQFISENMEFGETTISEFSETVHFTGKIIPRINGSAHISLPIGGIVTKIHVNNGATVMKGSPLIEVSGTEFINKQRDFAESYALLKKVKSNYERLKELKNENIGTERDFITAESEYAVEKAKFNALRILIENIGLDITKIEEGSIYSTYTLYSPIDGYIVEINSNIGKYVDNQQPVFKIINPSSFQLVISIFEKDIAPLKIGQKIDFYINGNTTAPYRAKLYSLGRAINKDTKSIDCFAEIENIKNIPLFEDQFVEGEICIAKESAPSLPETSIIRSGDENYILALEKEESGMYLFKKIKVKIGRKNGNFVEILGPTPSEKLLIKGTYNIQFD